MSLTAKQKSEIEYQKTLSKDAHLALSTALNILRDCTKGISTIEGLEYHSTVYYKLTDMLLELASVYYSKYRQLDDLQDKEGLQHE